jgi:hypothetical protein
MAVIRESNSNPKSRRGNCPRQKEIK